MSLLLPKVMFATLADDRERPDLESQVLAAALAQSYERGDLKGIKLAHKHIFNLLKDESEKSTKTILVDEAGKPAEMSDISEKLFAQPNQTSQASPFAEIYTLLKVSQMSSSEAVHKSFWRQLRKLLPKINSSKKDDRQLLTRELQKLWICHDILTDTVTRTDYDFRELGLRGLSGQVIHSVPEDQLQLKVSTRTPLRIGELLQCAGLLEATELEIACDMHKAMPEMKFGSFLVKQGFIQERDLESVLVGQSLIRMAHISIAQYQVAMELAQSRGVTISEILIERGYASQDQVEEAYSTIAQMSGPPQSPAVRADFFKRSSQSEAEKTGDLPVVAHAKNEEAVIASKLEEKAVSDSSINNDATFDKPLRKGKSKKTQNSSKKNNSEQRVSKTNEK